MDIIKILIPTSPITVPFIALMILGYRNRRTNKMLSLLLFTIGVVYLLIGGGICLTLLGVANHGVKFPPPSKPKFESIVQYQDGTKSYEYGHRGIHYEINVIEGIDTIYIGEVDRSDSISFSRINQNLVQFTNNKELRDFELFIINRKDPKKNGNLLSLPVYCDTTNSIMISFYKRILEKDDEPIITTELGRPRTYNVLQFTDLYDFDSSDLNMDDKSWPNFPEGYTLQIKNNVLIVKNNKKTWKYDIQSQLNQLKN